MEKVVRSITVKKKRGVVQVIGYGSSNRGTRIVVGVDLISTENLSQAEIDKLVEESIEKLVAGQVS